MTQKNKTILVGLVALAVWIYAGKEWLGYLSTDAQLDSTTVTTSNAVPSKLLLSKESYKATYDYSDPFLSSSSHSNISKSNTMPSVNSNPIVKTIKQDLKSNVDIVAKMDIKYQGLIQNEKGIFGLLTINNKSHVVSKGDLIDGIKVLNIEKSQIRVDVNGNVQTIEK